MLFTPSESASTTANDAPSGDWPRRIGLLNDHLRVPYANGSSFASQFLYREFVKRSHAVTTIGPSDPQAILSDLPADHVMFPSLPLRFHPGVRLPLPSPRALKALLDKRFDVLLGQSNTELFEAGVWLRQQQNVPFLTVNTVHLKSVVSLVLPDSLQDTEMARLLTEHVLVPIAERSSLTAYNATDGLVVLSKGLRRYWENLGVSVPIHVIPRAIEPKIFSQRHLADPFSPSAKRGTRLLVVCRHTREKNVERLIRLFAKWIAPERPDATLTLVGDGPDHDVFRNVAIACGVEGRCFFPGEFSVTDMPGWYRHADVFVYPSLSETYGQVVSEAKWCGLPVVAFADHMGVSDQITHEQDGYLVEPGPLLEQADRSFAGFVEQLLASPERRRALAHAAERNAREHSDPARCIGRFYAAFEDARKHLAQAPRRSSWRATVAPLTQWTLVQGLALSLGVLRPPQIVNRHGRKQPTWE